MFKRINTSTRRDNRRPRSWGLPRAGAVALLLAAMPASHAPADEIYFRNGHSQTAVVIRETDTSVRFKSALGLSTISREKIDFIEKASEEENQALLKNWREEVLGRKAMQEARREAERKFKAEQLGKGLVKFEGEWMTPARRQEILDLRKRAREHKRRFGAEQLANGLVKFRHIWVTPEHDDELHEMELEIHNLHRQITDQQRAINSIRSAMLNVPSMAEAEKLSKRIEDITASMDRSQRKLGRLLDRADEIEAVSVKYEAPEKFREALE